MKHLGPNKQLVIRKGFAAYGLVLIWLSFATWAIVQFSRALLELRTGEWQPTFSQFVGATAFTLVVGVGFLWLSASLLKQKYVVSLEGIKVERLLHEGFFAWTAIKNVEVLPTFAGANVIKLFTHDKRSVTLFLPIMAHYKRSAKAILEAMYLSGADIRIHFAFGNDYGPPPYGIFEQKAEDTGLSN